MYVRNVFNRCLVENKIIG